MIFSCPRIMKASSPVMTPLSAAASAGCPSAGRTEGKCRFDESFGFGLFFLQPLCDEGPLQVRELRRDQPLVAANVCGTPGGGQGSPRLSSSPDGRDAFLVQGEKPLAPKK